MNGIYSKTTSTWAEIRYSQAHLDARMRGWLPTDGSGLGFTKAVLYAQGGSWGAPPFYALEAQIGSPDIDHLQRVAALMDMFRANGYAVFHVNYPAVAGTVGATEQDGQPVTFLGITTSLAEASRRVRNAFPAVTSTVAVGSSAGGTSWGQVAAAKAGTYVDRPDGLVLLEAAPSMNRLDDQAPVTGAPAYLNGDPTTPWNQITQFRKTWASPLLPGGLQVGGPGEDIPVAAVFPPSPDLGQFNDAPSLLASWTSGDPLPGYKNPHSPIGGAGLELELMATTGRSAPAVVWWGNATTNPGGAPGIPQAGKNKQWSAAVVGLLESHLD